MLNLIQHLTKSTTYETLKQVQGDKSGLFTRSSFIHYSILSHLCKIVTYCVNFS